MKTKILVFHAPMVEVKYWALCSEGSGGSRVLLKALCDVLAPPVVVGQRGLSFSSSYQISSFNVSESWARNICAPW